MDRDIAEVFRAGMEAIRELKDKALTGTNPLYLSDTDAHNVNGYAIYAIEEATFTTLSVGLADDSDTDLSDKTLTAGSIWYLPIHKVTLSGGSVFVYEHKKDNS